MSAALGTWLRHHRRQHGLQAPPTLSSPAPRHQPAARRCASLGAGASSAFKAQTRGLLARIPRRHRRREPRRFATGAASPTYPTTSRSLPHQLSRLYSVCRARRHRHHLWPNDALSGDEDHAQLSRSPAYCCADAGVQLYGCAGRLQARQTLLITTAIRRLRRPFVWPAVACV